VAKGSHERKRRKLREGRRVRFDGGEEEGSQL